jgi:uncharacterized membrane protein YkvA (DUF1232 family)
MPTPNQPPRVHSYYRQLQMRVETWLSSEEAQHHPCAGLYPYLPELFLLLTGLGLDARVEERERVAILSALKYIVAPFDLIPEGILGPAGYCDDLVLAALVVDRLASKLDHALLAQHWHGEVDVVTVARTILASATTMVGDETCTRLRGWLPVS